MKFGQNLCRSDDDAGDPSVAGRLQALAHPARLRILRMLSCRDACCCKDVVGVIGLAQSTVSQHLRILVEAGLVTYRPDRQSSRYSLDRRAIAGLSTSIGELLDQCCAPRGDEAGGTGP